MQASLVKPRGAECQQTTVKVQSLDTSVGKNSISNIRMLKVDVEGWELEVIKGAGRLLSKSDAPIICVEYSNLHPTYGRNLTDMYKYILGVNDYRVFKLAKGKETVSKLVRIVDATDLPFHDNLFCFLPNHLTTLNSRKVFLETR